MGSFVPKASSDVAQVPKGNVPGYVCNHGSPRNETLRCIPYFLYSCERLLHFEAAAVITAGAFILPGRYVISAGDDSRDYLGRITHRGVPDVSSDVASRSLGNHGYIRNLGRSYSPPGI